MKECGYGLIGNMAYCCEFDISQRPLSWVTASAHVLMLMSSGHGLLCWKDQQDHPLPADGETNFLHYLPAGRWRFVDVLDQRPAHIVALHFDLKCEDGADCSAYYTLDADLFDKRKSAFRRLMLEIAKRYRSHDFGDMLECQRFFNILLGVFCESLKQKDADQIHPQQRRCQKAITYLQSHYTQPLDIDKLVTLCMISRPYFFALFHLETGMTAQQYLCRLRIERAKKLLLFSTKPVAEIGQEVGWLDPFHFSRIFSRETGCSPSKFRDMAMT